MNTLTLKPETVLEDSVIFLIHRAGALPQPVKAAASYYDDDWLEDMDEFDKPAGYRISTQAAGKLIDQGFTLKLGDQTFDNRAAFEAYYAPQAIRERRDEARRLQTEKAQREQAEREAAGKNYEEWRTALVVDLVQTSSSPEGVDWTRIRHEPSTTPGTWYTTGDTWYEAQVEGQTIYKQSYGNAVLYYAPITLVDAWAQREWDRVAEAERPHRACYILEGFVRATEHKACYGDDEMVRLVEALGLPYFINLAHRHTWLLADSQLNDAIEWSEVNIARRFEIPYVALKWGGYSEAHKRYVYRDEQGRAWAEGRTHHYELLD